MGWGGGQTDRLAGGRDRPTDRQKERETETETDRQTDRHREREGGREGERGEGENSNWKTLILKDSSVRSICTCLTAGPCYTTNTSKHDYTTNRYYKYE